MMFFVIPDGPQDRAGIQTSLQHLMFSGFPILRCASVGNDKLMLVALCLSLT